MKKYLNVAKITMANMMAFPTRFFSAFFGGGLVLVVFVFLWGAVYQGRDDINGLTFNHVITYYAVIFMIQRISNGSPFATAITQDVQKGSLSMFLIKPVNYTFFNYIVIMVESALRSLAPAGFILLITIIAKDYFVKPQFLHLFFVSFILGAAINFLIKGITGITAFWLVSNWGIRVTVSRLVRLINGTVIPVAFLPPQIINLNNFLPFQSIIYTPTSIYIGILDLDKAVSAIGQQIFWVALLAGIFAILWKKGIKKYDSVGN